MNSSGPVRNTFSPETHSVGYVDIVQLGKNIYSAVSDGKKVLLKTAKEPGPESFVLLRREYAISCNLVHPYILSPIRFDEHTPVGPAIVMDYVEGETLREFLLNDPKDGVRRKILYEILDAVEYLHRKELLHNDIKLSNILVSDIGHDVCLIDFGLSENDAYYLSKRLGGTVGASAPEVLGGDLSGKSDASADIYAIGGIIERLFPKRYSAIVHKCHRPNPAGRYRSVDELRRALKRRDSLGTIALSAILFVFLLLLAWTPYGVRSHREDAAERAFQKRVRQIQMDVENICRPYADTVADPALSPYWEFAFYPSLRFNEDGMAYRATIKDVEFHPVFDSVFRRMWDQMMADLNSRTRLQDALKNGSISNEEYDWYIDLFFQKKPFSPYPGK